MISRSFAIAVCGLAFSCSSEPLNDEAAPESGKPGNSADTPNGALLTLAQVYARGSAGSITDLDFDPLRPGELWATLREPGGDEACTKTISTGCAALEGHVVIIKEPASQAPQIETKTDPNGWHFMRRPAAIAFGTNGNFATCGEARTANFTDESVPYNGPALWSSDPQIFAIQPPGKNGSHLDMLHASPYCMGVAHERDNVYWAFNGDAGALDRYDFALPHEIGGEDHADGSVQRFADGAVKRSPGIPSHIVYDPETALLYVADTGNRRIVKLDTKSGTSGSQVPIYEPMVQHAYVNDANLVELVAPGVMQAPSGIALYGGELYATDNANSKIYVFGLDGAAKRVLDTGLASGSLAGITLDPRDGTIYLADMASAAIWRVTK